jgi:LysR family transcriptional regulator, hydrogen peroxide-inducible genes activator
MDADPTIRQLRYAVALDEHRHFGRAADALHVSQPGLSAQLQELERRLGVALFERSRNSTRPTPAGFDLLDRARRILRDVDDLSVAARMHADELQGLLRVAAIPTIAPYLLPTVAQLMHKRWPRIELELEELRTAGLVEAVERGDADLGLIATPADTRGLMVENLLFEPFHLAVAQHHQYAEQVPISVRELTDVPLLLLEEGHCLRDHALQACQTVPNIEHREVRKVGLSVLAQMVATGRGATLLPEFALSVEARVGSGIVTRPFSEGTLGRTLSLVWRKSDPRADHFTQVAHQIRRDVCLPSSVAD